MWVAVLYAANKTKLKEDNILGTMDSMLWFGSISFVISIWRRVYIDVVGTICWLSVDTVLIVHEHGEYWMLVQAVFIGVDQENGRIQFSKGYLAIPLCLR